MHPETFVKWALLGFLFFFMAGALATLAKADEQDSMWAQMMEPSYKLFSGNTPMCSATAIHSVANADDEIETYFLTAAHCVVKENMNVRKQLLNEKMDVIRETVFYLETFRSFKDPDVAVLKVIDTQEKFPVAMIADVKTNIKPGRNVWAVGYPKAREITITHGEYTGKAKHPQIELVFQRATAPITGGNSGGAVYIKTPDGYQIFGVTSGHFRDTSFMNYFTSLESIHRALPRVVRDLTEKMPLLP